MDGSLVDREPFLPTPVTELPRVLVTSHSKQSAVKTLEVDRISGHLTRGWTGYMVAELFRFGQFTPDFIV